MESKINDIHSTIPELPQNDFAVDVPDDGNCFFYAILLSLKVISKMKIGEIPIQNIDNNEFMIYLTNLIDDKTTDTVAKTIKIKSCWAGQETVIWMVDKLKINIVIYDISAYKKGFITEGIYFINESYPTVKLIFTGNHYMSYFESAYGVQVADMNLKTLSREQIMKKVIDRKFIEEQKETPNILELINRTAKILKAEISDDPRVTLNNIKKISPDTDISQLEKGLKEFGLKKYYLKYLKYKAKYLKLKNSL